MRYCTDCGNGHDCTAENRESAESDEVKIARINREADVAIAKLAARSARDELATAEDIAETQADAEVAAAVAEAEVVGAAIEAGIQPAPEPMIIDAPAVIDGDGPDDAPPPVEGSAPPAAKKRSVGLGAW